jgi:FkbM family methyltransferase
MHFLGKIHNATISGYENPYCYQNTEYYVNNNVQFSMCIANNADYLTNGNSITKLISVRGFMPTCRILHLLYWMLTTIGGGNSGNTASSLHQRLHSISSSLPSSSSSSSASSFNAEGGSNLGYNMKDSLFVDIGANIGSCSLHMASLGLPVLSVEPVAEHVQIIMGSLFTNPSFHVDLYHGLVSSSTKTIKAKIISQNNNWGNTSIEELPDSFASEVKDGGGASQHVESLAQYSLDSLLQRKKVSLLKIDCEGCEYEALFGATKVLHKIPIIKMEVIHPTCKL